MKGKDIRKALPDTPDSVTASVQAAIAKATAADTKHGTRIRPRRLAVLVAAAAVVLVAAGFTVAAASGAFKVAKEEAAAEVESFDYQQVKANWAQANWTPWALVNATGSVNGTTFTLEESMLYKQNAPDYYLSAEVFYDADADTLKPELDTLTMTVDGRVLAYDEFSVGQWNAGGVWFDGRRYFTVCFLYEDNFPVGSEITLSGMLHTYDGSAQTGEYGELSITYTLTQAMVDAMTEKNAAEMADAEKQALEQSNAVVQQLPDKVTVVNAAQGDVQLHEVSFENGRFFFSFTLPQGMQEICPALSVNGVTAAVGVIRAEGENMQAFTYYCSAALPYGKDALPAPWTVAIMPDSAALYPWFIFRFEPDTGKVQLPTDDEYEAWVTEWQGMGNTLPTSFLINDTQTVGGVTVRVDRLEYSFGTWILYAYLSGNRDFHTPQEYAPVITANGAKAAVTNEYERYAYSEPYLEGEGATPVFWEMELPLVPDANGQVRLTIDWQVYDRADDGSAAPVGTYRYDKTL